MLSKSIRICLFLMTLSVIIPTFAQDRQALAEDLFSKAEALRRIESADSRREAIRNYEAAIQIFSDLGLRSREAQSLNNIGFLYGRLGEFARSVEVLDQALQISREVDDKKLQILTLLNMGRSSLMLGRNADSLSQRQLALSISREIGDREMEASALNDLGVSLFSDGELRSAIEQFTLAASIFESLGRRLPHASILNNIGRIDRLTGDQENALGHYLKALSIFQAEGHLSGEADVTLNLASTYADLFRTAEAMEFFDKALLLFQKIGDRQREAVTLNNIGTFYTRLGEQRSALDYYRRSALIAEDTGDKRLHSMSLRNLGTIYLELGELEKAKDYLDHALELTRLSKNRPDQAATLMAFGMYHIRNGDFSSAKKFLTESLLIHREAGSMEGQGKVLFQLGLADENMGRHREASTNYNDALTVFQRINLRGEEAKTLANLARTRRALGEFATALKDIEKAIELFEYLRSTVPVQELRSSYFSVGREFYELYIDLLLNGGPGKPTAENHTRAFVANEHMRARSLLETLTATKLQIRRGVDPLLLEHEHSLRVRLNNKEAYRSRLLTGRSTPDQITAVETEIRDILNKYYQVRSRIQVNHPAYAALVQTKAASVKEIQEQVLDPDSVLVAYSVGRESSYAWTVTQDSIRSYSLPKRKDIETAALAFYRALTARNSIVPGESEVKRRIRLKTADRDLRLANVELSNLLLSPLGHELTGKRILIVPDDILQYIPFGALITPLGGSASPPEPAIETLSTIGRMKYLIETNEIVILPSASSMAAIRGGVKVRSAFDSRNLVSVIADPVFTEDDMRLRPGKTSRTQPIVPETDKHAVDLASSGLRSDFARLRFSRTEALSIAGLVPNDREFIALDFDANREIATSPRFGNSQIIHFATHAVVDSSYPELSGIVLSLMDKNGARRDGYLRLHDIYDLQLNTDLVVLSACETALGKDVKGEGIVGLTRGFMYAGARSVVASYWRVEDKATADLMKRFYQRMLHERLSPSAALRASQMAMLKEKTTSHPFYWSGFAVQGEWKAVR